MVCKLRDLLLVLVRNSKCCVLGVCRNVSGWFNEFVILKRVLFFWNICILLLVFVISMYCILFILYIFKCVISLVLFLGILDDVFFEDVLFLDVLNMVFRL